MKTIIRNSVKCLKCGDGIESVHRHDFKYCSCGNIAVDGGKDYLRRLGTALGDDSYKETSIENSSYKDEEGVIIKATSEQIVKLADIHILKYREMIRLGEDDSDPCNKYINLHECYLYYDLWKSIINKQGLHLTDLEESEVKDACYSGEYDHILMVDPD